MLIYVHIVSTFQALRSSSSSSSAFARCCPSAAEYLVVEYIGLRWSTKTLEAQRTALLDSAVQGSVGSVQGALLWWLAPSEEGQASEGLAKGFHSPDWGMVSDFDMGNEWTRELQSGILAEHVAILTTQRHASSTTGSDGTIDVGLEKSAALLGHWLAKARLLPLWVWLNAVNVRRVSVRTTDWNARNRGMHSWSVLCDLSSLGLCERVWSANCLSLPISSTLDAHPQKRNLHAEQRVKSTKQRGQVPKRKQVPSQPLISFFHVFPSDLFQCQSESAFVRTVRHRKILWFIRFHFSHQWFCIAAHSCTSLPQVCTAALRSAGVPRPWPSQQPLGLVPAHRMGQPQLPNFPPNPKQCRAT